MFDSVLNTPVRVTETHVGASIFRSNFSYGAVKSSVTDETFRGKIFSWSHILNALVFPILKRKPFGLCCILSRIPLFSHLFILFQKHASFQKTG